MIKTADQRVTGCAWPASFGGLDGTPCLSKPRHSVAARTAQRIFRSAGKEKRHDQSYPADRRCVCQPYDCLGRYGVDADCLTFAASGRSDTHLRTRPAFWLAGAFVSGSL